ncbi:MAG: Dabb family protein [Geminicoccaceae bacterium]
MTTTTQLRHVVLFGFKVGTADAEITEIARRFAELRGLIPGITDFEWGVNNSPEGKNQGLTHCFTLTFSSDEARDAYLPHTDHVAFANWARAWIERVTVVDYWTKA